MKARAAPTGLPAALRRAPSPARGEQPELSIGACSMQPGDQCLIDRDAREALVENNAVDRTCAATAAARHRRDGRSSSGSVRLKPGPECLPGTRRRQTAPACALGPTTPAEVLVGSSSARADGTRPRTFAAPVPSSAGAGAARFTLTGERPSAARRGRRCSRRCANVRSFRRSYPSSRARA